MSAVTVADFSAVYHALHKPTCPMINPNVGNGSCRCGTATAQKAFARIRDALRDAGATVTIVDPGRDCGGGTVACSLAGDCGGHDTGKLTAVDVNGEVRHYAKSERAAKRWAQRFARQHGGTIVDDERIAPREAAP